MKGLKVYEVARMCNVRDTYISRIIHRHEKPGADLRRQIARILGKEERELFDILLDY